MLSKDLEGGHSLFMAAELPGLPLLEDDLAEPGLIAPVASFHQVTCRVRWSSASSPR